MNKQLIIILDFSTQEVHVYDYDQNIVNDYEEYYILLNEEHGTEYTDSNCQCMIVNDKLKLSIH